MASIETNLNQSPYFDDFDETKNFHRVLFRPGYAVQARELTQLQTILQNQVERFGDEFLSNGTVINGCDVEVQKWQYVKLRDKDANNRSVLLTDFQESGSLANCVVEGSTTGVTAKLLDAVEGSEGAAPNYLSVFVSYTNSGANNTTKAFANNETLIFRQAVGNTFVVAANTIQTGATGTGLGARASDGIVYHKGNFIRSHNQSAVVSKYTTSPSIRVGFETNEDIIDSNKDSTLLDNASGATNFSAPGAARLKISTKLTSRSLTDANTAAFFPLIDIQEGTVIKDYTDTSYGELDDQLAKRTFEESGNYSLDKFTVRANEHLRSSVNEGVYDSTEGGDNNKLVFEVSPAVGYVRGYRTELINTVRQTVNKGTDTEVKSDVIVGQAFGNYVIVDELAGTWDFQGLRQVVLYDTAQNAVTAGEYGAPTLAGNICGTANIRGFQYESGVSGTSTGRYRLYLFNIKMNSNKAFADTKSIYINSSSGPKGIADVVLENNRAVLKDKELALSVFPLQSSGVKTLKDASDTIQTQYVFRTEKSVTVNQNAQTTVSANTAHTGAATEKNNETGDPLTSTLEKNIIVVSKTDATTSPMTGKASRSGTTVSGTAGTLFTTQYRVGEMIKLGSATPTKITAITNNTTMTVADSGTVASGSHAKHFPAGYVFDLASNGTITSTDSTHTIDLQQANLASSFSASVYFNVLRTQAQPASKTVIKDKFIHINTATNANSKNGPWELGTSDVYKIVAVYQGANTSVAAATGNVVTEHFTLDNGQRDTHYDNARLIKNPNSDLDLTNKGLLVQLNYFGRDRSSGIGFLTTDSYPVNDATPDGATNITTQEIPVYKSDSVGGKTFDLRDCVDFRPMKTNSVTPSASGTAAAAPTNPTQSTTFDYDSSGAYLPTPDKNFQCDLQRYLPRIDKIALKSDGSIITIKGASHEQPQVPMDDRSAMTLATVAIPPYPSLSPEAASHFARPSYEVRVQNHDTRRFTMGDLRKLEAEVGLHTRMIELNRSEIIALKQTSLRSTDALGSDEPPKDSVIIDPGPAATVENTLRPGDISFSRQEMEPIPSLTNLEMQLQTGYANIVVQSNRVTTKEAGTNSFLIQKFNTKARTVTVDTTTPAKLFNGQMRLNHSLCYIHQNVCAVESQPKIDDSSLANFVALHTKIDLDALNVPNFNMYYS